MPNTRKADLEQLELLCVSRVLWLRFCPCLCRYLCCRKFIVFFKARAWRDRTGAVRWWRRDQSGSGHKPDGHLAGKFPVHQVAAALDADDRPGSPRTVNQKPSPVRFSAGSNR